MLANLIADLPSALCMLLGSGLIILEVFLPGFGLPGISGVVLIGAGTVVLAIAHGMLTAVAVLLVLIAALAVAVSLIVQQLSRSGVRSELFLHDKEELHTQKDMQVLVGRKGRTSTVLRPAGIGDFDGVRLNIVTQGGFIERNMPVEIVSVEGSRIVVCESDQESCACAQ